MYDYEKFPIGSAAYLLAKAKFHLANAEMCLASGVALEGAIQLKEFEIASIKYVRMKISE
jgi:hypothetical protein